MSRPACRASSPTAWRPAPEVRRARARPPRPGGAAGRQRRRAGPGVPARQLGKRRLVRAGAVAGRRACHDAAGGLRVGLVPRHRLLPRPAALARLHVSDLQRDPLAAHVGADVPAGGVVRAVRGDRERPRRLARPPPLAGVGPRHGAVPLGRRRVAAWPSARWIPVGHTGVLAVPEIAGDPGGRAGRGPCRVVRPARGQRRAGRRRPAAMAAGPARPRPGRGARAGRAGLRRLAPGRAAAARRARRGAHAAGHRAATQVGSSARRLDAGDLSRAHSAGRGRAAGADRVAGDRVADSAASRPGPARHADGAVRGAARSAPHRVHRRARRPAQPPHQRRVPRHRAGNRRQV